MGAATSTLNSRATTTGGGTGEVNSPLPTRHAGEYPWVYGVPPHWRTSGLDDASSIKGRGWHQIDELYVRMRSRHRRSIARPRYVVLRLLSDVGRCTESGFRSARTGSVGRLVLRRPFAWPLVSVRAGGSHHIAALRVRVQRWRLRGPACCAARDICEGMSAFPATCLSRS